MKKLRLRNIKYCVQGHSVKCGTASHWAQFCPNAKSLILILFSFPSPQPMFFSAVNGDERPEELSCWKGAPQRYRAFYLLVPHIPPFLPTPPWFHLSCCHSHLCSLARLLLVNLLQLFASFHPFLQLKWDWNFPRGILLGSMWRNNPKANNRNTGVGINVIRVLIAELLPPTDLAAAPHKAPKSLFLLLPMAGRVFQRCFYQLVLEVVPSMCRFSSFCWSWRPRLASGCLISRGTPSPHDNGPLSPEEEWQAPAPPWSSIA